MADKKALKILFGKYWEPARGWVRNDISESDFNYAKRAGVMFDDREVDHDTAVTLCREVVFATTKSDVINAFLSSLSTRRLDWRSALASFACGHQLPHHAYVQRADNSFSHACICCTEYKAQTVDLNVLNFERHKFGGVRHQQPIYVWLDLKLLRESEVPAHTDRDVAILKEIIQAVGDLKDGRLSDAERALKGKLNANQNERRGIIATLGFCGVLFHPDYPNVYCHYVPYHSRRCSSYAKSDWPFPSDVWLPEYGLNQEAISYWFGSVMNT